MTTLTSGSGRQAGRIATAGARRRPLLRGPLAATALMACACGLFMNLQAREPAAAYAFIGPPYVITAEAADAHRFVLNFFNLSDFVIVVQPEEFIYKGGSGQFYIGQVFDLPTKGTRGDDYRYSASFLLRSHSYKGLDILGAFHEQQAVAELSIRIGSKRYYLTPLNSSEWGRLEKKIENLDMTNQNAEAAFRNADLAATGRVVISEGGSGWDLDWEGLLLPGGVNPPRILDMPEVAPTDEALRTKTFGKVRLSAIITRDGAIQDLTVVKGLGRGLDVRATEAVKSSWTFLPATRNGEVIETSVKFDVTFSPPKL